MEPEDYKGRPGALCKSGLTESMEATVPEASEVSMETTESMGDTHKPLHVFTVVHGSVVFGPDHREGAPALGAATPAARASLGVYTRKLRKRLRDGVKERAGGGTKVPSVPDEVAALVTTHAVAAVFPAGKPEGACGVCGEHKEHLSLQLVSHTEASIALTPMCASCVVGLRRPKPARPARARELAKRYTLWKEMTSMAFEAGSLKERRKRRWAYFKGMEAAVKAHDWKGAAWSSATPGERELFRMGLSETQAVRNKQKFALEAEESRKAALAKRMTELLRQNAEEHCVKDVLG